MKRLGPLLTLGAILIAHRAIAQTTDCSEGVRYDDGTFESSLFFSPSVASAEEVLRIDPPASGRPLRAACICWQKLGVDTQISFDVDVWAADGPNGGPGTSLGRVAGQNASGVAAKGQFFRVDLSALGIVSDGESIYVGPHWSNAADPNFQVCIDSSGNGSPQPAYLGADSPSAPRSLIGDAGSFPQYRSLGIRAVFGPDPPDGPWLTTTEIPGFQFKVQITSGATSRPGTQAPDCVINTLCLAGAIPAQPEILVRISAPKPNGYRWPSVVKFVASKVEVWIQKTTGGPIKYYLLPAVPIDSDVLPGLIDHTGFLP